MDKMKKERAIQCGNDAASNYLSGVYGGGGGHEVSKFHRAIAIAIGAAVEAVVVAADEAAT
jgi:hypothetical protein